MLLYVSVNNCPTESNWSNGIFSLFKHWNVMGESFASAAWDSFMLPTTEWFKAKVYVCVCLYVGFCLIVCSSTTLSDTHFNVCNKWCQVVYLYWISVLCWRSISVMQTHSKTKKYENASPLAFVVNSFIQTSTYWHFSHMHAHLCKHLCTHKHKHTAADFLCLLTWTNII